MKRNRKDKKTIEKILRYRIKNYSYDAIGKMFHLSRQRIHQIIKTNESNPEFKELYREMTVTHEFLNRKIRGEDMREN